MVLLLRSGTEAEYCDLSVRLSVREHISGTAGPIFTKVSVQINVVYTDFEKAFDKVSHKLLLRRLRDNATQ